MKVLEIWPRLLAFTMASLVTTAPAVAADAPHSSSSATIWVGSYRFTAKPAGQQPPRSWVLRLDNEGGCLLAVSESTLMQEVACSWTADTTSLLVAAREQMRSSFGIWDVGAPLLRLEALATRKLVTRWLTLDENARCLDGQICFINTSGTPNIATVPIGVRLLDYGKRIRGASDAATRSIQSVGTEAPAMLTEPAKKLTTDCADLLESMNRIRQQFQLIEKASSSASDPRRDILNRQLDMLSNSVSSVELRALGIDKSSRAFLAERTKQAADKAAWVATVAEFDQANGSCKADVKQCQSLCRGNPGGVQCVVLASAYADGDRDLGIKKDIRKAGDLAFPPCKAGDQLACKLIDALKQRAAKCSGVEDCKPYCDAGLGDACSAIGGYYINGDGVRVDAAQAFSYRLKGCDHGSAEGCLKAGIHYMQGWGTAKDWTKAERALARCCEMKEPVGCQLHSELCWRMGTCR